MANLPTTGEFITDPHGLDCPVLDVTKVDFSAAVQCQKKKPTLVKRAKGNETLGQTFQGKDETFGYTTSPGDAIFINGPEDRYVIPLPDGTKLQFNDLDKSHFTVVSMDGDEAHVKSPPAKFLIGIVDERICIKNAWGEEDCLENHQFLSPGASLKKNDYGKISGMDKEGFDKWEAIDK